MCRHSLCICRQRITFPLSAHPLFLYKHYILSAATLTYRFVLLLFFMKTRVNLHTHRLNYTRRRHMYDVYDMGNVHLPTITTTNSRSKTSSTSIPFIQLPPPIQSQPQFSPMYGKDASSTFTHAAYQNTQRAYQPCLKEAQGLYQALNMYHYTHPNEKLNPHCIRKHDCCCHNYIDWQNFWCEGRLASYVVQAWEVDPSEASITEIASLMHHLLSTTASKNDTNEDMDTILMEYAHKQQSSMPTPCPNLTLLVAIRYIDRLKKVTPHIKTHHSPWY